MQIIRIRERPLACLVDELMVLAERDEGGMPPNAHIKQEVVTAAGTITQLECEICEANCSVVHENWKLRKLMDKIPGDEVSFEVCPYNEPLVPPEPDS